MALNKPTSKSAKTDIPARVTAEVFNMVNSLDKALRAAGRLNPQHCDPVAVLAPIADASLDIYGLCEQHGGVYEFPITPRVLLWFTYVYEHPKLLQIEGEAMDFRFFEQPDYRQLVDDNRTVSTLEDGLAGAAVKGAGFGTGSGGVQGDNADMEGDGEEGEEYRDDDGDWQDGEEGDDDAEGEEDIAMAIDEERGRPALQKRKSSDPMPYGNQTNPTKRTRRGDEETLTVDEASPSTLRDEPSAPNLIKYPVRCEKCVQSNVVCYIPLNPATSRTCDWCKRVKKPCSYLQNEWVEALTAEETKKIKAAVAEATSYAPPAERASKGKAKAAVKQVATGAGKVVKKDGDDGTVTGKKGGRKGKATAKSKGDAAPTDWNEQTAGPSTRSRAREPEVRPFPSPQSPTIPTIYSLTGIKIDLQSVLKVLAPDGLQVPTPNNARASSSSTSSSAGSRQPSPRLVPPVTGSERSIAEISQLFDRAASLDGEVADVQGQLRALHRHAAEEAAIRQEVELLKRGQEKVEGDLELVRATTQERLDATDKLVHSMDNRTQLDLFQTSSEKQFEKYEEDRRGWSKWVEENEKAIQSVQGQLGDVEKQVQTLRHEMTEHNQQQSADLERTITTIQRNVQQSHDGDVGGATAVQLLRTIEGYFRQQNEALFQRIDSVDQRLNALALMVTQQNSNPHGYPTTLQESRHLVNTVSPKAIFPSQASIPNHFVAEVPRLLSSPAGPHSFGRDSGLVWGSTTMGSDFDRRYTNYSGVSSGSGQRSALSGLVSESDRSTGALSSDTADGDAHDATPSGSIQIPPNWSGGGKTGRRPTELDSASSRSVPQEGSLNVVASILMPAQ
ncbi:hypothetical protein EST38_g10591 [Candolleomyces aberdarensis]|uniref:Zn(2)-C6 fungal-type domain-containing protein n=1 Tax=Candolleomyces aberdarensis TaxID=2316362 RepID=A0A4Q2D9W0_9AGAR|nr:hypothetical protein EST38_g10591 [Candolleomyces aberdarensis]